MNTPSYEDRVKLIEQLLAELRAVRHALPIMYERERVFAALHGGAGTINTYKLLRLPGNAYLTMDAGPKTKAGSSSIDLWCDSAGSVPAPDAVQVLAGATADPAAYAEMHRVFEEAIAMCRTMLAEEAEEAAMALGKDP